jgi:anthranilate/para-aminobenzoate synthase component I
MNLSVQGCSSPENLAHSNRISLPSDNRFRQLIRGLGLANALEQEVGLLGFSDQFVFLESGGRDAGLNQWNLLGLRPLRKLALIGNTLTITRLNAPEQNHSQTISQERISIPSKEALFHRLREESASCVVGADINASLSLPIHGGLMGYWGYEFYQWCDAVFESPGLLLAESSLNQEAGEAEGFPTLVLFEFQDLLFQKLGNQTSENPGNDLICITPDPSRYLQYQAIWKGLMPVEKASPLTSNSSPFDDKGGFSCSFKSFTPSMSETEFCQKVEDIQHAITEGALYQANLSMGFRLALGSVLNIEETEKSSALLKPFDIYERLCQRNPSPFAGVFAASEGIILCNSPERLVQVEKNGRAQTRPIAGTRGRGATPAEDLILEEILKTDEKERAEHLMLVDLHRNDLGKVTVPGTVVVDELMVLEQYSHVVHLVSNVVGQRATGCDGWDIIKAMFPGGSITGCPKIRCIQTLQHLEPVSRGPYTGSLGYMDSVSGSLDLNILIRSIFITPQALSLHAGAGIVADSVAEYEYQECLKKAAILLSVLTEELE